MSAEPFEIGIDPLVELFGVDTALVSTEMGTQKSGDHRCAVGAKQLPRGITLDKLRKLKNLGDGGHASILDDNADIGSRLSAIGWSRSAHRTPESRIAGVGPHKRVSRSAEK